MLLTFINLQFAIKTFVLSIFEWPLKTVCTSVNSACSQSPMHFFRYMSAWQIGGDLFLAPQKRG